MSVRVASFEGGDFERLRQHALHAKLTTIEQAAAKRSSEDPDDPRMSEAAVALLLFETLKLTAPDPAMGARRLPRCDSDSA